MKNSKILVAVVAFVCIRAASAQENVFLDRAYWKANPSIEKIETDSAAGNDSSALTPSMFDAVCYALMEKTDNTTIKYLLTKKGNEVDKRTHDGRTYIFWAAYTNNLEIMTHLVAKGAKTNIEDSHGYSVLNFAAVTGQTNTQLYDFLVANGADITATNHDGANALLLVAPFAKTYDLIRYFTEKGLPLEGTDTHGNGIFHYAAKGGHIPLLQALVKRGVPYNYRNKQGGNAMLMASQGTRNTQNDLKTYLYLEALGLEANVQDTDKRTPLHTIAKKGTDRSIFTYFIEKGIATDQQDTDGRSPFMNAANSNSLALVQFLFDDVTNINAKDNSGHSALSMAVQRNSPEVVRFLLEKGADINVKDTKGNTLAYSLLSSYKTSKPKAFEAKLALLQEKGLKLTETQSEGNSLLHLAAKENNLALLKRLEEVNINIDQKNEEGNTVLHLAAMSGTNEAILKYLITRGADSSLKTPFEETAFDLASENELLKAQGNSFTYLK